MGASSTHPSLKSETGVDTARLLFEVERVPTQRVSVDLGEPWVVDLAMVLGTGFAPFRGGPLRTADALGLPRVVGELEALRREHGERFEPAPLLRERAKEGRGFYSHGSAVVEQEQDRIRS